MGPTEIQSKIQEACTKMSMESRKALKELAYAIKSMTKPCSIDPHIVNSKAAAKTLKSLLETHSCEDVDLLELMSTAVVGLCLMALSIKFNLKMFKEVIHSVKYFI